MSAILYTGLHDATLELLKSGLQDGGVAFSEIRESEIKSLQATLARYSVLVVGEEVHNPVRVAQEAYAGDKHLSVLLVNDEQNFVRVKQSLQFSPFIGPTVTCVSNQVRERLVSIVQDAILRSEQRRSFQHIRKSVSPQMDLNASVLDKVRGDYTAKVLEVAPIGAVLVSGQGNVLTINAYAAHLFGKTEREILGASLRELFPAEVQPAVQQFVSQAPIREPKKVFELKLQEQVKYLEASLAQVNAQRADGLQLLIINDITATVQAQQHTQAHLEELERMNAHLTRLNADLDTFVYTASHDLKSPILNIEGLVGLLEASLGEGTQVVAEELKHIKASVQRFKNTVEDLTEVARIQRSFEQEAALLQVGQLVEEVKELISFQLSAAQAQIDLDCSGAPQVHFAKRNLKSILYNLISNAIKYRSPGRIPHIQVKTWQENGHFVLQVQDNGLGIPANKKEKVFELFKRIHVHVKGTGIGLYIVKRIVQNNGGSIQLDSVEGEGSTFTIKLKV